MEVPNCVPLKCPYTTGKPSQVQTLLLRLGGGRGGAGGGAEAGAGGVGGRSLLSAKLRLQCLALRVHLSERNAAPENSP